MVQTASSTRREPRASPDAMTLLEHLAELRRRIIVCMVFFVIAGLATYFLYNPILHVLRQPYCEALVQLKVKNPVSSCHFYINQPLQGFTTRLNVAAYGGIVFSLPIILYELWRNLVTSCQSAPICRAARGRRSGPRSTMASTKMTRSLAGSSPPMSQVYRPGGFDRGPHHGGGPGQMPSACRVTTNSKAVERRTTPQTMHSTLATISERGTGPQYLLS